MPELTAVQRLELGLPASLAWTLARSIARQSTLTDKGRIRCDAILARLAEASLEPVADLHGQDRDKLNRRLHRLTFKITGVFIDVPILQLLWALHEAMRILIEAGGIELIAGGAFDRGWTELKSWCFEDDETTGGQGALNARLFDQREAVGRRLGHRLLAEFQREGLYRRSIGGLRFSA